MDMNVYKFKIEYNEFCCETGFMIAAHSAEEAMNSAEKLFLWGKSRRSQTTGGKCRINGLEKVRLSNCIVEYSIPVASGNSFAGIGEISDVVDLLTRDNDCYTESRYAVVKDLNSRNPENFIIFHTCSKSDTTLVSN